MITVTTTIIIGLIILLAVFSGSIVLQIFLSKREKKWFGLILPVIFLVLSFIAVANLVAPVNTGDIITVFLLSNILTFVFIVIYFACREKLKNQHNIDKMKVQDL
jgi:hypothetical protein